MAKKNEKNNKISVTGVMMGCILLPFKIIGKFIGRNKKPDSTASSPYIVVSGDYPKGYVKITIGGEIICEKEEVMGLLPGLMQSVEKRQKLEQDAKDQQKEMYQEKLEEEKDKKKPSNKNKK